MVNQFSFLTTLMDEQRNSMRNDLASVTKTLFSMFQETLRKYDAHGLFMMKILFLFKPTK